MPLTVVGKFGEKTLGFTVCFVENKVKVIDGLYVGCPVFDVVGEVRFTVCNVVEIVAFIDGL